MYHKIIGPTAVGKNISHAAIRVLPKSSMVGTSIFFRVYENCLNNLPTNNLSYIGNNPNSFNKQSFTCYHGSCPGFPPKDIDINQLKIWDKYTYYTSGWDPNGVKQIIEKNMDSQNEVFLNSCKIVFIFRNPLDYLVSYHRHQWNSCTDDHKYSTKKSAMELTIEEFAFDEGGLGSWLKQFFTFHAMREQYSDMILFIPYEELINNRYESLLRIINHLGLPFNQAALLKAMDITSINNMRLLENKLGKSISNDQKISQERHIRSGAIGDWQKTMSVELVAKIEKRMNELGLSLSMFHLADELDEKFYFLYELNNSREIIFSKNVCSSKDYTESIVQEAKLLYQP